jgi:thiosulfate/3-mercaptopyruvate sulfurtransferase
MASTTSIEQRGYAHPDALVSTDWVALHADDPGVRLIESNEDTLRYASGHLPGAVHVDWSADLNDPVRRDYIGRKGFEGLMSRIGVMPDTVCVFYGDTYNWWSCYAFWVFQLFGHTNARIMDGGRLKWGQEGRPFTRDVRSYKTTQYSAHERDDAVERAFLPEVLAHVRARGQLVDVRSHDEYTGARLHMADYPNEGALRGGHIPGALNVPWELTVDVEDGTFRGAAELRTIYVTQHGLDPGREVITYCRIGERSSHTWFALKYLLGLRAVRNYDGSWTEWGNVVGVPIER